MDWSTLTAPTPPEDIPTAKVVKRPKSPKKRPGSVTIEIKPQSKAATVAGRVLPIVLVVASVLAWAVFMVTAKTLILCLSGFSGGLRSLTAPEMAKGGKPE